MAIEEEVVVTEVWANNLMEELPLILEAAELYPYVALDTEFPGFLRQTPRFASPEERYQDVKYNADRMKLIQIGLTFFDVARGGGGRVRRRRRLTWQINLREFDVSCPTDARWEPSIDLLRGSGVDLERTREEGVDSDILSDVMLGCGWMLPSTVGGGFPRRPRWVTFHGIYDIAYLLKLLTQSSPLPETLPGFIQLAGDTLGSIFDAKHIAGFCGDQCGGGNLGLVKLSEVLQVQVPMNGGAHHQAGYDSLLTSVVFETLVERFHLSEDMLEGFICGLEEHRIVPWDQEELNDDARAEDDEEEMTEANSLSDSMIPHVCGAHCRPPLHRHGRFVGFEVAAAPPMLPAPMVPPAPFGYADVEPAAVVVGDGVIFFC